LVYAIKKIETMRKIYKLLILTACASVITWSCNESEDLITANAVRGGLVETTSTSNSYVVGNSGPYEMEFFVNQDETTKIESIDIYKSFSGTDLFKDIDDKDSVVAYTSNEVLDRTLNVSENGNYYISTSYMFDELTANLTAKGAPLPTSDGDLRIGDKFLFRAEVNMADGRVIGQEYQISFGVSTRYAGKYKAVDAEYYRIGSFNAVAADWPAETVIESVDATTYKVVEYFGLFDGNEWYFQIIDGKISYPAETPDGVAQSGNGQPFITCESNPADMTNVPCGPETNIVINDDVKGKDRLVMTYGYYTASGDANEGSREFYQVLEKIVK
jgi:hypothetical protein